MAQIRQKRTGESPFCAFFRGNYPCFIAAKMKKNKNKKILLAAQGIFMLLFFVANTALASEINSDNIIKLVNSSREKEGLMPLKENEKLNRIAQSKLDDMVTNKYFAHTSPQGTSPWYWFEKNNYDYRYAGENLAINFLKVEDQHEAWMKSPTHKKNILNSNYLEIGVAVGAGTINGQNSIIAVQEFGTRVGSEAELNDSRNFSGKEKTNLIKEGEKLGPAVLSVKDIGGNTPHSGNGESGAWKSLADSLNDGAAYQYLFTASFILIILAITVAPAVFVIEACKKSWPIMTGRNSIAVKFLDNINEIKLIRIHLL